MSGVHQPGPGRTTEEPGKPVGSVHGASVGVHASDAANASFASLIAGAYHAHRGLYLVALTRVMASHFGFPAPGYAEAQELLST